MRDIPGFEGLYGASEDGRIWSHKSGRRNGKNTYGKWLIPWLMGNGYEQVSLYNTSTKKGKKFLVHRLVAMAYLPNPYNLPQVNHLNGKKRDNRVSNLEWCTPEQNTNHAVIAGINPRVERHWKAKLTKPLAWAVRIMASEGVPQKRIAKILEISQGTVSDIVLGNSYFSHKDY